MIESFGKFLHAAPWAVMVLSVLAGIVFVFFPRDLPNTQMFRSRWIYILLAFVVLLGTVGALAVPVLGLVGPLVLLIVLIARPARAGQKYNLSNRGLIPGIWAMSFLVLITIVGIVLYYAGGCEDGFKNHARCEEIPDDVGQVAFAVGFTNLFLGQLLLPLLLFIGILIEVATRYVGRSRVARR